MKNETIDRYINIYILNNKFIMLDYDLAKIFGCNNGVLEINYSVRKNIRLFSKDDYFLLNHFEYKNIVMQNKELERKYIEQKTKLPYAFSEYGVYLLSLILKTSAALKIQKELVISFINMKNYINQNLALLQELSLERFETFMEEKQLCSDSYDKLFKSFNRTQIDKRNKHALYNGKIYDCNKLINTILENATNNVILTGNQIDINILESIKDQSIKIVYITSRKGMKSNIKNLIIKNSCAFSETFIFIDCKRLYHLSDINDKDNFDCIAINIIKDKDIINTFRRKVYLQL